MRIYVGCPIDQANQYTPPGEQIQEVIDWALNGVRQDAVVFNPFAAFHNAGNSTGPQDLKYVVDINSLALRQADLAIFAWNGSPSFGVPLEISYCAVEGIPFVIYNKTDRKLGLYARQIVQEAKKFARIVNSISELDTLLKDFTTEPFRSDSEDDGEVG